MRLSIKKTLRITFITLLALIFILLGVSLMRVNRTVLLNGIFEYRALYPVVARESGYLDELRIKNNSPVLKGDILAILDNPNMLNSLRSSEIQYEISLLELEEFMNNQETEKEKKLIEYNLSEKDLKFRQYETAYYKDQAEMKRNMYENRNISKQDYESALLTFQNAQAREEASRSSLDTLEALLKNHVTSLFRKYQLKKQALNKAEEMKRFHKLRYDSLNLRAPEKGVFLSEDLRGKEGLLVPAGFVLGQVVSFNEIDFIAHGVDEDILRIREGQTVYFDVELFRRKVFITGKVKDVGFKSEIGPDGRPQFPIHIEVDNKLFFDREMELFIQSGVTGQAVIITEEGISLFALIWEKIRKLTDFEVYIQ